MESGGRRAGCSPLRHSRRSVQLFVLPFTPMLIPVLDVFERALVKVRAHDLFWMDRGAYTGGVSGSDLRALGCSFAAIGQAERRSAFSESQEITALKFAAAVRNLLEPVLCVGEADRLSAAAEVCIAQIATATAALRHPP